MYLVHAKDAQIVAGKKVLIKHATFTVLPGDKIGIVGKNGTGKTTTLQLMTKKGRPFLGEVDVRTNAFYVPQNVTLTKEERELPVISYALSLHDEGWNVFHVIEKLFDYHAITGEKTMGQLSGGELTMLHLALGFLIEPELLLLDEPTNHLDMYGTKKLIAELKQYKKAIVVVSHDIYLLNELVTKIFSIKDLALRVYTGNYDEYRKKIVHDEEILERRLRVEEKKERKALDRKQQVSERILRRESDQTKMRYAGVPRIQQGYFLDQSAKSTSRDMAKAKKEERATIERIAALRGKLRKTQTLNIELGETTNTVYSLVDIHQGTLTIADNVHLLTDITLRITNEDKVLLSGRNGVGKSSLLSALQQKSGFAITDAALCSLPQKSMYIDQHYALLDPEKTVFTHISELVDDMEYEDIRRVLGNYLFLTDHQINQKTETLSGGEKARLSLAIASVQPRTLLLLDEPTNNLDTESIEELVTAINTYEGGVIIVSHDIGFIERIQWTKKFEIKDKHLIES